MIALSAASFVLCLLLSCLASSRCGKEDQVDTNCSPFSCGEKLGNLKFPFCDTARRECGFFAVDGCNQTNQMIELVKGSDKWFEFLEFDRNNFQLRVRDRQLQQRLLSKDCQAFNNLSLPKPSSLLSLTTQGSSINLFKCSHSPIGNNSIPPPFADLNYTGCQDYTIYHTNTSPFSKSPPPVLSQFCSIIQLPVNQTVQSSHDPFKLITPEFNLDLWISDDCTRCSLNGGVCVEGEEGTHCRNENIGNRGQKFEVAAGSAICAVFMAVVVLFVYSNWIQSSSKKWSVFWKKKKNNESLQTVEAILKNKGSFAPKRYTYSEVKKITNSFKNKLGDGGYGEVYHGKLTDNQAVAVKVLKESRSTGEEFINEVINISRTSHVNVVTLMGFCFERPKRALIYEFMPNGSLERFIYSGNAASTDRQLGWETLYQIAVATARGLEYLHRGCNTRIVHFDIKPHNILLDGEFCPKIADFGLSKLCSDRKQSVLSVVGARGTPGYIAPEVLCRNFGGVSHKSDVYSYGMMVLEMVGGRKNIDAGVEHSSEIYFPHWIHGRLLNRGDTELELHGIVDEERAKVRKMIIVGLWCIQTDPNNRPAMHVVLDMLQGSIESLQIPPLPMLSS